MLPPAARAARTVGVALVGAALLGACGGASGPAGAGSPRAEAPAEPVRTVPEPVAGALHTYVDAAPETDPPGEVLLFGDSVTVPDESQKYPRAHRRWPQ